MKNVNFSKRKDKQRDRKDKQASRDISCKFYHKKHEFGKKIYPAWGKECKSCKIKNHFEGSLVCKGSKKQKASNKNNSTNFTEGNDYSSDESLFTVTQYVTRVEKPGQSIVSLSLSNQKDISGKSVSVKCLIDTGSTWNIMPFDILQNIAKNPILNKTESQLKFYDGETMKSIGKHSLYTKIKDKFFKLRFEVVSTKVSRNPLLSGNTSENLSLISINNEVHAIENSTLVETLVKKYADIFEKLGVYQVNYI